MNKYWIHEPSGRKALVTDKDSESVKLIWKGTEDYSGGITNTASKEILKKFYIPITQAEYYSSLTLKDIKNSRNIKKEIKGFPNEVKQCVYDNRVYKIGDLFITKIPCATTHPDITIPENTLCYIYQILKGADNDITIYIKSIPSVDYIFEEALVTTPIDLPDILDNVKISTISKEDKIEDELKKRNPFFVEQYNVTKEALEQSMKDNDYPKSQDTFESICQDMVATHKAKNSDYGNSFHNLFKELGINYAYGHLREKLERIKTLKDNEAKVKGESMIDSLKDLANYAIMTIMELQNE